MKINSFVKEIRKLGNKKQAQLLQGFFKTAKGEYGEGDIFLGIKVPVQRELIKKYWEILDLEDLQILLNSKIHEERLSGLFMLVKKYQKSINNKEKEKIFDFYIKNVRLGNVNNWDLVDLSAPNIVGEFLVNRNRAVIYSLAKSPKLWEKRVAILSCFWFIRNNDFKDAIEIAKILLNDSHDLIHKAVGWMLREIGKRDLAIEERFLKENNRYRTMPRTMLRYAIERFEENKRQFYLKK